VACDFHRSADIYKQATIKLWLHLLCDRKEGDKAPGRKQILLSHNQRDRETSTDMQLIQLNLKHCRAAQNLLKQTVRELDSEVANR